MCAITFANGLLVRGEGGVERVLLHGDAYEFQIVADTHYTHGRWDMCFANRLALGLSRFYRNLGMYIIESHTFTEPLFTNVHTTHAYYISKFP